MTRSVVLGIGNILLTDDGVGVHVARHLEGLLQSRDDVEVIDAGTLSFTLAPVIADAERLIVIDAAQLNAPPGTVRTAPFHGWRKSENPSRNHRHRGGDPHCSLSRKRQTE